MKWYAFPIAALFLSSCDTSDYVIDIKSAHITLVTEDGGNGYIVVEKQTANNMAKSSSFGINAKNCLQDNCKVIAIGLVDQHNQEAVKDGVKLRLVISDDLLPQGHPSFWLNDIACIKIDGGRFMGSRRGESGWHCNIQKDMQSGN